MGCGSDVVGSMVMAAFRAVMWELVRAVVVAVRRVELWVEVVVVKRATTGGALVEAAVVVTAVVLVVLMSGGDVDTVWAE